MLFLMRILQFNQMKRILKDNYYMDSVWQKMGKNYKMLIKQKKPLKFLKKLNNYALILIIKIFKKK